MIGKEKIEEIKAGVDLVTVIESKGISLKKNDQDQFNLCIADNGVGFTYETAKDKANSIGLQLVNMLACGQLKGSIEFNHDHGSRCSITFSGVLQENSQEQVTDKKDSNS